MGSHVMPVLMPNFNNTKFEDCATTAATRKKFLQNFFDGFKSVCLKCWDVWLYCSILERLVKRGRKGNDLRDHVEGICDAFGVGGGSSLGILLRKALLASGVLPELCFGIGSIDLPLTKAH